VTARAFMSSNSPGAVGGELDGCGIRVGGDDAGPVADVEIQLFEQDCRQGDMSFVGVGDPVVCVEEGCGDASA